jgi:chromosome partitioning protein
VTVVSIANLKGGVGKSTLTMVLGEFLSFSQGYKVLLIDMDSQANLSAMMIRGADIYSQREKKRTVYHFFREVLAGHAPDILDFIADPPLQVSNISGGGRGRYSENGPERFESPKMVPSCPDFAQIDQHLVDMWRDGKPYPQDFNISLARALRQCADKFHYVLIDCPPGLTVFTNTALVASDYFISPIVPEPLAVKGVELLQERVAELNQDPKHSAFPCKAEYAGGILNLVQPYRKTHQRYGEEIYNGRRESLKPFRWYVPFCETLRKVSDFDANEEAGKNPLYSTLVDKYSSAYLTSNPKGSQAYHRGPPDTYRLFDRFVELIDEFVDRCPATEHGG